MENSPPYECLVPAARGAYIMWRHLVDSDGTRRGVCSSMGLYLMKVIFLNPKIPNFPHNFSDSLTSPVSMTCWKPVL